MGPTIHSSQKDSIWKYVNPYQIFCTIWRHRELTWQLTLREIQSRYKGSYLGLLWPLITPLFMLGVYSFVFGGGIMQSKLKTSVSDSALSYPITLFCGLIIYSIFAEAITAATKVVVINPSYVTKVVFPLEVLPVTTLYAALFQGVLSGTIFMTGLVFFIRNPPVTILYFPLILFSVCVFTLGLSWFVAALGVFIRDISHTVMIFTQVIFFCSALFYEVTDVPERFRWLIFINPIAYFISDSRMTIIHGQPPNWRIWGITTLISLVIMQLGYMFFMRSKRAFGDVL